MDAIFLLEGMMDGTSALLAIRCHGMPFLTSISLFTLMLELCTSIYISTLFRLRTLHMGREMDGWMVDGYDGYDGCLDCVAFPFCLFLSFHGTGKH